MLKAEKERIVEELTERLKSTPTLFVADYRGLSVSEIDELRTQVIQHGARFTVVKNTLTKRAAEAAGADALLALLDGPTAIAFIEADGDLVAVAKALADSARTTRVLAIRGGILDGAPIGEEDVKNLATLPPLEVLRGQVIGAITSPLMTVVGLIAAPVRDLIGLIDARIEQLEEQGDTEVAAEPVAAESAADEAVAEAAPDAEPATDEAASEQPSEEETAEPVAAESSAEEAVAAESDDAEPATDEAASEQPSQEEGAE
jgi:large subunit ribosomal protein L10